MDAPQLAERMRDHSRVARLVEAFAATPGAYLVGGAVRDLLRGAEPVDLDVVVEGVGPLAAREAASRLGGEVRAHARFGTATVTAPDVTFDVVSARAESYPAPGALPEVRAGTLDDDLARRDFTVNAIAAALHAPQLGEVREYPGAREDLEAGRLRVMHPGSFRDDPTRLLRLVRYAARLEFEPETRTDALARDAIAAGAMATVTGGRIGTELRLLAAEPTALGALTRAGAMGLAQALHPSFEARLDLAREALARAGGARPDLLVLAACVTRFERGDLEAWLDRLELPGPERDAVVAAALDSEILTERLSHAHRASELRHLLLGRPAEEIAMAAAHGAAEAVARWEREVLPARPAVTGDDLVAAGVPEGPAVGRGLDAAWRALLDEGVEDREAQLAAALQAVRAH